MPTWYTIRSHACRSVVHHVGQVCQHDSTCFEPVEHHTEESTSTTEFQNGFPSHVTGNFRTLGKEASKADRRVPHCEAMVEGVWALKKHNRTTKRLSHINAHGSRG